MVARRRRESNDKVKNDKTMLKILPFIRIPYLKQQSIFYDAFEG